jgi:AraC-like DNA-binding protein
VERQGADASAIRCLPGLDAIDDPDVRVPEATAEMAWRLAATFTRDTAIGLHVAEALPRGALDLVEYAFRSSPSLSSGLERLARYGRVLSDRVAARVDANGGALRFILRDTGTTAVHPARAEFGLATALRLARETTGAAIVPQHVCFAHAAPADVIEYERFFRAKVRFDAGSNSLILDAEDAGLALAGADAALAEIVRRRLEKALVDRDRPTSGPLAVRVRRLIVEHLGQAPLTPDAAARMLAVSRRSLSRRLAEEGTTFSAILDEVRAEFARALLGDRTLSIADIAFFLQYSEPAAFHRSFRRWTGQTPGQFRSW